MREALETADSSLSNLEDKTSIIEERLQEIDGILKEIEASIYQADARGDPEIGASLQKNLSQKQVEYEQQAGVKKQISLQLNQLGAEIEQLQAQNNRSREEVAQLDSLGENVSDGTALIQERQGMLQSLEQRYQKSFDPPGSS